MTNFDIGLRATHLQSAADVSRSTQADKSYALVAWISLIGVLLPPRELSLQVGVNLTPGRMCVLVMFIPALVKISRGGIQMRWPDVFALATAGWIVVASVMAKGADALLTAAGAESLEFLGAYMIGRAYLGELSAQRAFIGVLRIVTVILLVFALADRISGQWLVENTLAAITHTVPAGVNYREGVVRATATLDHPILLGSFFSLATGLFLFSNDRALYRFPFAAAALLGCYLSLSSASVMAWVIIVCALGYDKLLGAVPWRWRVFWFGLVAGLVVVFLVTNAPLGWVLSHLTWDPQSAYFRYLIWNLALDKIAQSPIIGFDFTKFNDVILDTSVDSVWLAYALRFGVPMIAFLFLANLTAIWPSPSRVNDARGVEGYKSINTGYTVVLCIFMFIGLTVHLWNFMWIFWGICLGTRVSLKQRQTSSNLVTMGAVSPGIEAAN